LWLAIAMYLGAPGWLGFMVLGLMPPRCRSVLDLGVLRSSH
jgi:hypothetical protein